MQSEGPCNLEPFIESDPKGKTMVVTEQNCKDWHAHLNVQFEKWNAECPIAEGITCNWDQQESTTEATTVAISTMKIAPWNMEGFNKSPWQKRVESLLQRQGIGLMRTLETKLAREGFQKPQKVEISAAEACAATLQRGRMLVIWDEQQVKVEILDCQEQLIQCQATCKITQLCIKVTFVYGMLSISTRKQLWNMDCSPKDQ